MKKTTLKNFPINSIIDTEKISVEKKSVAKQIASPFFKILLLSIALFLAGILNMRGQTWTVGTGTTNNTTSGISPFSTTYHDGRTQYVYLASELIASGATAGLIHQFGFDWSATGGQSAGNVNLKMANTTATNITALVAPTWTNVWSSSSVTPTINATAGSGYNLWTLTTPFNWDGTSNIIIEICFDNTSWTSNWGVRVTQFASGVSRTFGFVADNATGCTMTTGTSASASNRRNRPNARFVRLAACSGTPTPGNTITSSATVVSGGTVNLSLQNATSGTGVTYQWQSAPTSTGTWTNIGGATAATYTATVTANTWYRCIVTCSGNNGTSTPVEVRILEGNNCDSVQDLALLSSPFSGTTVGYSNSFTNSCLTGTGGDRIFKIDVPNGAQLFIGQSTNGYDSRHRIAFGGSCPGTTEINTGYVGNFPTQTTNGTFAGCLDDDDLTHYYFNNTTGATQTVYWIQDGHSTGQGTFTLEWQLIAAPTCITPSALTSSTITSTSATITWTAASPAPSDGYEYFVSTSATAPTAGTTPTASTAAGVTTANLTGLTANTTYFFWVRSNCGASDRSTWAGSGSFFTGYCIPAAATSTATYFSNFVTTGGTTNIVNNTGTTIATNGYGNYYETLSASQFATGSLGFSATIAGGSAGIAIFVDWNNDLDFTDAGELVYTSNAFQATGTTTSSFTIPTGTPIGDYRMRIVTDFNATNPASCAFSFGRGEMEDYKLSVVAAPSCLAPTALTSSAITSTSATISWTAASPAPSDGYEYFVSTSATAPTAGTTPTGSTAAGVTTANLTGLAANTTYYFWVRSNCGGTERSTWAGSGTFFTGYCVPTNTNSGDYISSFSTSGGVLNINNSGTGTAALEDFTSQVVSQFASETVSFSGSYDGGSAGFSIWVDWNNDLIFEASERMFNASATAASWTGSFTIPAGQALGNYRMRIRAQWNTLSPPSCGAIGYGQAEDYTLSVVADTSVRSIASGNWNSGSTWNTNIVPTCSDNVVIMGAHTVTVNSAGNVSSNLTINSGGTLDVASGDLTVGCTLNNTPLTNNGTLTVSGGTLNINGNLSSALGSTFNQSGGNINIDGNNGGSSTGSVASGTPLLNLLQLNSGINWTGGTLTIVDPHTATTNTNGYAVFYSNATAGTNYPSANHTVQFGNGTSSDAGGHTSGFYINSWVNTALIPFGSCNVNGPTGTNRSVTSVYHIPFRGNVTVNNGGVINLNQQMSLAGDLNVNSGGTIISIGLNLQNITANTGSGLTPSAVSLTQSIGGSGTYQNLATGPTANLTSFSVNNTSAGGVTITAPLSISGTLTMTAGKINTTATNVLTLGTATAAGTLTYTAGLIDGPFRRTYSASGTTSATYNNTTLFPVGVGTTYLPLHLDPVNSAGVVQLTGQAFNTNSGTAGVGVASTLSNDRWEALVTSGSSNLTNCFVGIYDTDIVSGRIITQSASANGTYNTITPTSTFVAAVSPLPNGLRTATSIASASYLGYFTHAAPGPVITSFTPNTACSNQATTITITGTNLSGATSVTLNGEACTITSNTATQIVVTTDATPQTGNIVVTTPANSVVSSTALTVNPSLPASVSIVSDDADNTICAGTSVTFTATPTNGGTTPTYQWFVGTTPVGTNSNTYTSTTLANNDVVTVQMTSNATPCLTGSPATSSGITMTVNPIPTTANAGPDQQVCSTNTITLAANTATSGTGAWSIISGAGGTVTTPSSPTSTFTGTTGTTYTLRWTISSGTCAASTDDVVITIFSPLDYVNLQFPGSATICQGGSLTAYGQVFEAGVTTQGVQGSDITVEFGYNTTNNNPSTWTNWFTATYNTSSVNNNNDEYQYTFTPPSSGTYFYTFRYRRGTCDTWQYGGFTGTGGGTWGGSNVSGVLTVNSNAAHTIALSSGSSTQAICQNTPLGTNIVYAIGGGATGAGVTGLPSGMSGSFSSGNFTISGTPSAIGTFNYTVTTTGNGCATAVTATGTITVSSALDYVNLQFPGSATICQGGSFTAYGQVYEFGVTTVGVQGSGITVEFGYNTTNNNPSTWTNWFAATFNTSSVNNNNDEYQYTFTPPSSGTYFYTFRYKQGGCDWQYGGFSGSGGGTWGGSNVSGVLTVNPTLTASVSVSASPSGAICSGTSVTFTATPTNGGTTPTYQWFVGTTPVGTNSNTYTSTTLANNDVVTVRMTSNATPCLTGSPVTSSGITMTVNPNPTATISGNSGAICNNKTASFTLTGTNDAIVTYTINSGSNQTITLTGGTASVTIPNATANQTLNLVSVSLGSCTASLSGSSTVIVGEVATWNGTSWVGTPGANKGIIFNGNFSSDANLEGCSCTVNSGNVVINSNHTVKLLDEITVTGGSITFRNNSSLLQVNNVTNTGNITYERSSAPGTVLNTDYVYWASPVSGQNVPSTGLNYFWNNAAGTSGNWVNASGQALTAGKGVIMRGVASRNFTGVPFNGEITVDVHRRNIAGFNDNWNLIGNPYPSAISAEEFLLDLDNAAIEGSIAIWTHGSPISSLNTTQPFYGNFTYNYNPNDYIIYNLLAPQAGNYDGFIPAGQGFFVKYDNDDNASPTAASSTIKFKNSMRSDASGNAYSNTQFFRNSGNVSQNLEKSRIWIDIINSSSASYRTVVGYIQSATDSKDRLFDAATSVTASTTSIYSLIGNDKMCIQGKGLPFNNSDIIPLGFNAAQAGNLTIAIHALDGLFVNQEVYLLDTQLNITHNIKLTPYTFTAVQGENNTRFRLIFNNGTLSNPDFDAERGVIIVNKDKLKVISNVEEMESITVFDLLGRTIYMNNNINSREFVIPVSQERAPLIVKIKLANGIHVERKTLY